MSDQDEAVLFECSFTKAEIEVMCLSLEAMATVYHYQVPEGLKPALASCLKAFYSVKTTGLAV
jgi:hypothetical protein